MWHEPAKWHNYAGCNICKITLTLTPLGRDRVNVWLILHILHLAYLCHFAGHAACHSALTARDIYEIVSVILLRSLFVCSALHFATEQEY